MLCDLVNTEHFENIYHLHAKRNTFGSLDQGGHENASDMLRFVTKAYCPSY